MFAKLSGQLQGPQHNHLHLHAEVPSREEAIEAAREWLGGVRATPAGGSAVDGHYGVVRSSEGEPPGESSDS